MIHVTQKKIEKKYKFRTLKKQKREWENSDDIHHIYIKMRNRVFFFFFALPHTVFTRCENCCFRPYCFFFCSCSSRPGATAAPPLCWACKRLARCAVYRGGCVCACEWARARVCLCAALFERAHHHHCFLSCIYIIYIYLYIAREEGTPATNTAVTRPGRTTFRTRVPLVVGAHKLRGNVTCSTRLKSERN